TRWASQHVDTRPHTGRAPASPWRRREAAGPRAATGGGRARRAPGPTARTRRRCPAAGHRTCARPGPGRIPRARAACAPRPRHGRVAVDLVHGRGADDVADVRARASAVLTPHRLRLGGEVQRDVAVEVVVDA